ncbi:heme-degrading domain-containing protein [Microbacterium sp. 4R-513]|uniref:heme-degrading domain-containing protein n=1 Tax=Microbacterium sp. 4R-513 TaxID=2567934 RepID=UPI0013E1008E|nr:heme-degrading domain-containing protein [Microbacterium sp. 4R-513]QIG38486.1 heme-degrading domain-containing protein [Microbacterium sp. 4R-513]
MSEPTPAEILARVEAEEREIVLPRFDLEDAWRLGSAMRAAALERGLPIVIGISLGEARVFHTALPGSSADNDGWLERKARVARRYGRSSYGVGLSFTAVGKAFDTSARLDTTLYAAHGGVFPITIASVGVVGTVGVSGLPQADDHAFVVEHLRAHRDSLPAA